LGDGETGREEKAAQFDSYLHKSGMPVAFQIIFSEIVKKEIPEEQVFQYTAMRLR
jgi:hypothetical protein